MEITIYHYLFVGLVVFLIGLLGTVLVKHIIKILISVEIMLLGVNINFVTFAAFCDNVKFDGFVMALFYVGLGAVELAVALYIFYLMYQKNRSSEL